MSEDSYLRTDNSPCFNYWICSKYPIINNSSHDKFREISRICQNNIFGNKIIGFNNINKCIIFKKTPKTIFFPINVILMNVILFVTIFGSDQRIKLMGTIKWKKPKDEKNNDVFFVRIGHFTCWIFRKLIWDCDGRLQQ